MSTQVGRDRLTDKLTCEQSLEGSKRIKHCGSLGKYLQVEGMAGAKALGRSVLAGLRSSKESSVAGKGGRREEQREGYERAQERLYSPCWPLWLLIE